MTAWEIICGIVLIILAVVVVAIVLLQEGNQRNLGAISGAADSFMEKGKARSLDTFLSKWTKFISIGFFVLVFVGMLLTNLLH